MDRGRLREVALRSVRWVVAGRAAVETVALAASIILAHLLTPAEFGRAAVALILVSLSAALTGNSLGTPLVQRRTIEEGHVRSAVTLSLVAGAALTVAAYVGGGALDGVFGAETANLLQLISPIFLIASLGVVPHALLQRSLDFRRLSSIEVASILVRTIASVALAAAGLGAPALIVGALAGSAAFTGLLAFAAPRLRPGWHQGRARELLSFGVPAAGVGLIAQLSRNVDYAILGARLPAAQVGYYWRAYQLGVEYERKLTTITTRMALPIFSRARDLSDMRRVRIRMMRLNAIAVFGVLAAFVGVAPTLVPWVFGAAWEPSVLPAQILAVAGMVIATGVGSTALVMAAGRPRALLWLSVAFLVVYSAVIFVASARGIVAVCVAGTIVLVARTFALHWLILDRLIGIPLTDLRHELAPATAAGVVLLVVSFSCSHLLDAAGLHDGFVVGGALFAGASAYLAVLRFCFAGAWRDMRDIAARVLGRHERRLDPAAGMSSP